MHDFFLPMFPLYVYPAIDGSCRHGIFLGHGYERAHRTNEPTCSAMQANLVVRGIHKTYTIEITIYGLASELTCTGHGTCELPSSSSLASV
jgi:hypothetical protein